MRNSVRSSQIVLREHEGIGGSDFDSLMLSNFFNFDKPHHFGQMVANIFTSSNIFSNKVLTSLTLAQGNFVGIDSEIYRWTATGDDARVFRVTELVETTNTRPGFAQQEFSVVLDKPWVHEPDILMPEDNRFLVEVVGHAQQLGEGRYLYRLRMQSSDPTKYLPAEYIQPGRTFRKAATSVANTMNRIGGTGQFGSQIELESQIGAYAESRSVDDKIIRKEIAARRKGNASIDRNGPGKYFSGYTAPVNILTKDGKPVEIGMFMTFLEAEMNENLVKGREVMMNLGEVSQKMDYIGKHIKRTGPGYRELVLDGHTYYHNGSITAQDLEDFFMQIFMYRKDISDRSVVVSTGSLGSRFFSNLLADEAASLLTVDSHFIRKAPGGEPHQLEYGMEFISFTIQNGIKVRRVIDPMKDDKELCPRLWPDNPMYTVDSGRMDIYDSGRNSDSIAPNQTNMSMIMENGVESYMWVSNAVNPRTGVINDGSLVASTEKGVQCFKETSGSLGVWDTSRIASIIFEPEVL